MVEKSTKEVVLSVIKNRKSVRSFIKNRTIPKEDFNDLLKAGMSGPSGKNAQPWRFIAINDKETVEQIAKITPYAEMLIDAGNAIVTAANTTVGPKEMPELWVQDLGAATENILLAAEAMGLGACWCQVYPIEARINDLRKILDIPPQLTPFNIICLGYPTGFDMPQDKWDPRKIYWNKWMAGV